jgi:hypothetical protein
VVFTGIYIYILIPYRGLIEYLSAGIQIGVLGLFGVYHSINQPTHLDDGACTDNEDTSHRTKFIGDQHLALDTQTCVNISNKAFGADLVSFHTHLLHRIINCLVFPSCVYLPCLHVRLASFSYFLVN